MVLSASCNVRFPAGLGGALIAAIGCLLESLIARAKQDAEPTVKNMDLV